jgi:hypothetical protein
MGTPIQSPPRHKAHIFGFDQEMTTLVNETLFFAGAEPTRFADVTSFTKAFKKEPPALIVLPLKTLKQLELHVMLGSDPRFDSVNVITAADDPYDADLRDALESCAIDYFLTSQPYHLKRLAMAVMSRNPWSEAPTTSGRLMLAEADLERRIAIARVMRIAQFDVLFVDDPEDLLARLRGEEGCSIVVASRSIASGDLFERSLQDSDIKRLPWLVYGDEGILSNTDGGDHKKLSRIGAESNPDTLLFHVQDILKKPLEEMRQSKRQPMYTPVRFSVDTLRDSVWAYTRDMSLKGIFVRTIAPPPPETIVTVNFRVPTAEGTVQVGGRVAWRKEFGTAADPMKPPGMGLELIRVSAPDGAAIEAGYNALTELLERRQGG